MKYYIWKICVLLMLSLMLTACAERLPAVVPSPSVVPQTPAPVVSAVPTQTQPQQTSRLEVDLNAFFGKDPNEALGQLRPVLESVAKAACTYRESFTDKPSDSMAWNTVYTLLNYYSAEFTDVAKQLEDGTLEISSENMRRVFKSCFAYPYEKLPEIGPDYEKVLSYDATKDVYHVGRASDMDAFQIENATLSEDGKSVIVEVNVLLGDSSDETPYKEIGKADIEIVADSNAKYLFTVKSVSVTLSE